ncbi:DUF433 domain-containing protein [Sulfurimonas sp. MAG313]|nr:DUF433 domain-containing protein [Sulfurimonas sp. MAG313]MDF1881882.1 DUF433 domain-containing protein [Sulfurimonas sp. MAG313]
MIDYKNYISIDPNIRSGKPIIRGMRITVYDILEMLGDGMKFSEILDDYPELKEDDIYATLAYAADKEHKLSICA